MKIYFHRNVLLYAAMLLPLVVQAANKPAAVAAKASAPAQPLPERSVFVMPSGSAQGRDPFFPNSTRPYEAALTGQKAGNISALSIKGFIGTGTGRMVIINNHTFAPGDEGDVVTSQGRMHVHCIEVKGNSVTIELDGQRHELNYHDNP